MGDEGGNEPSDAEHFGEGDNGEGDCDDPEILWRQEPRENNRSNEGSPALADKAEYLPEETFDGGTPETAQNLLLRRTGARSLRLQSNDGQSFCRRAGIRSEARLLR